MTGAGMATDVNRIPGTPTVHHPYHAGWCPKLTFLVSEALAVVAWAAAVVGWGFVFRRNPDSAVAAAGVGIAVLLASRLLARRAWTSVAWLDQRADCAPVWATVFSRGAPLVLMVAMITDGLLVGTSWSAALSLLISSMLAGGLGVRAVRGVRAGLAPRWRVWRIVDAAAFTATTAGVVAVLSDQLDAAAREVVVGLVVPALIGAVLGAGLSVVCGGSAVRDRGPDLDSHGPPQTPCAISDRFDEGENRG